MFRYVATFQAMFQAMSSELHERIAVGDGAPGVNISNLG